MAGVTVLGHGVLGEKVMKMFSTQIMAIVTKLCYYTARELYT